MSQQDTWRGYIDSSGEHDMYVGTFDAPLIDIYSIIYQQPSTATEQLSEEVEMILDDIDSGRVDGQPNCSRVHCRYEKRFSND